MNINEYCERNNINKDNFTEKYESIVKAIGMEKLVKFLPADKETLDEEYRKDFHLNGIKLMLWDMKGIYVKDLLLKLGINQVSPSETVCILKTCARMYIEG